MDWHNWLTFISGQNVVYLFWKLLPVIYLSRESHWDFPSSLFPALTFPLRLD